MHVTVQKLHNVGKSEIVRLKKNLNSYTGLKDGKTMPNMVLIILHLNYYYILPLYYKKLKFETFSQKSIFLEIVENWLS